jgi:RNA polymerase sigma-70 factor (ECF subfamily)
VAESESSLIAQAVQGDRDALARLLKQHTPALRRNSSLSIPQRWQALLSIDDVLQQTFTDAVLGIRRFVPKPGASFGGWLATIARRNLQDAIRMLEAHKRGGRSRPIRSADADESYDGLFDLLLDSTTTPSGHVARNEIGALLERAIDSLPQDHRTAVRMYDLEGRSVEDVAGALGRTPGAAYMLRARAHRWLREILGRSSDFFGNSRE